VGQYSKFQRKSYCSLRRTREKRKKRKMGEEEKDCKNILTTMTKFFINFVKTSIYRAKKPRE
jgi:hypothetical protein